MGCNSYLKTNKMNQLKTVTLILSLILLLVKLQAQEIQIERMEPPFWWTGMNNPSLQLLVYGKNISFTQPNIDHESVRLSKVIRVENPNYLFLDLVIQGKELAIDFSVDFLMGDSVILSEPYQLKARQPGSADRKGFNSSDVVYLLMPDRFANGNPANDFAAGMRERPDRNNPDGRHGGDLKGIMDHLDHFPSLGVTALWLNPFLENNNPHYSYHGYAITDFYKTDPRIGTNEEVVMLVNNCHARGLKVIMDQILNHASLYHWMMKDPPSGDWIHTFPEYTRSNFRAPSIMDPYASQYDRDRMLTGWFDVHMADLNQENPLLLTYFIQNSIWWIEFAGLDGIRLDTQPYAFKEGVARWAVRIFQEYPHFNIVGEAWLQQEAMTAYFQQDSPNPYMYNSNIPTVTDFPLYYALAQAFNETEGWTEGLARLYLVRSHDYLYADPYDKLIFCDNHDLNRYFSSVGEDLNKFKMAFSYLLTAIGTPMIYYGTEVLKTGFEHDGHGMIRTDFPGGWPEDQINAFERQGLTSEQTEALDYLSSLARWRKDKPVIHTGKMIHFIPENGIYVYFRFNDLEAIMVVMNNTDSSKLIDTDRYAECIHGHREALNPMTGEMLQDLSAIEIPAKSVLILELK